MHCKDLKIELVSLSAKLDQTIAELYNVTDDYLKLLSKVGHDLDV